MPDGSTRKAGQRAVPDWPASHGHALPTDRGLIGRPEPDRHRADRRELPHGLPVWGHPAHCLQSQLLRSGTVANLVVAKVGVDGKVLIYNNSGSTHVVVDVVGWYGA